MSLAMAPGNTQLHAQEGENDLAYASIVKSDRYRRAGGDPMYFSDWVIGTLVTNDAEFIPNVLINYNGRTSRIEVLRNGVHYELRSYGYLRMEVTADQNPRLDGLHSGDKIVFQRGIHQRFKNDFVLVLFGRSELVFFKEFLTAVTEYEVPAPGRTERVKTYSPKEGYYFKKGSELYPVRLREKDILEVLNDPSLAQFSIDNKLDLENELDVILLCEEYYSRNYGR